MPTQPRFAPLDLHAGELVDVRSAEEILATLDAKGTLDGLPFMPEMLESCGRQFRVHRQATKHCDRVQRKGMRESRHLVHLQGVRCDGKAHDGCQAGCLIFWHEAWLRRSGDAAEVPTVSPASMAARLEDLRAATRRTADGVTTYSCQATEQLKYSVPLGPRSIGHYLRDLRCGNARPGAILCTVALEAFNTFQRKRDGVTYPRVHGTLTKTPTHKLNVEAGDLVRVKTREEILATLDVKERNRGLSFDREMVPFCGGTYRVLRRVQTIVDEQSGRMLQMKGDCIILDGAACDGGFNKLCPRSIYPYWREIWLDRVPEQAAACVQHRDETFLAFVASLAGDMVRKAIARIRPAGSGHHSPRPSVAEPPSS